MKLFMDNDDEVFILDHAVGEVPEAIVCDEDDDKGCGCTIEDTIEEPTAAAPKRQKRRLQLSLF